MEYRVFREVDKLIKIKGIYIFYLALAKQLNHSDLSCPCQ